MKIESAYIYINEARFHAFHGVMSQERQVGADFTVSLRVGVDMAKAIAHDLVELTLDYGALYRVVEKEMAQPAMLLESVAGRIAQAVFDTFPQVQTLDLRLTKVNPPFGGDCQGAGVELHLINDKTTR
ncbi:MAG: dihydroneopterin aldolase [Prevotella sp.]|nr:dihydroneopterin aldolase [Prevotella sp.]